MALDWNKEIKLSNVTGLLKRRGDGPAQGSGAYPTKVTMNLYQGDKGTTNVRKTVMVGVLLVVIIALFVKFGVLDPLSALSSKQAELARQEATLAQMKGAVGDYAAIKEAYDGYMARYGAESSDAIALLAMVEQHVMPRATVSSLVLAENTLTITLYNVPLDTVGEVARTVESQGLVSSVNVTTATTQNVEGQNTVSTLVATLAKPASEKG